VGDVRNVNLATRVEPQLAESVRRLTHLGHRTVTREVAEAVRRHVLLNGPRRAPRARSRGRVALREQMFELEMNVLLGARG
jgi:hypothetical protein